MSKMTSIFFVGLLMMTFTANMFVRGGNLIEITEDDVELFQKKVAVLIDADDYLHNPKEIRDEVPEVEKDVEPPDEGASLADEKNRLDPRNQGIIIFKDGIPETEKKLYIIMHARYLHFWSMLSYYTCALVYADESPEKNEQKALSCRQLAYKMFDFINHPHYYGVARNILDHEIGTAFSLRQISASLQLLIQGYAQTMTNVFKKEPTKNLFGALGKVSENIPGNERNQVIAVKKSNKAPAASTPRQKEPIELYYEETFARILKFYGKVLNNVERFFNSALVDDKDFDWKTMVPNFEESKKLWEESDPSNHQNPGGKTPKALWVLREGAKFKIAAEQAKKAAQAGTQTVGNQGAGNQAIAIDGIPSFDDVKYKLVTQPSGASEYVVLLDIPAEA